MMYIKYEERNVTEKYLFPYRLLRWLTCVFQVRFICRISAVSNAIQTKDNEANHLIIYCLNCIRHGRNATHEPGLSLMMV